MSALAAEIPPLVTPRRKVAVLVPPNPGPGRADQNDTFEQAAEVVKCLETLGHEAPLVEYVDHGEGTIANIRRVAPDMLFNLVEEVPEGADQVHRVTSLLDRLGFPYSGARTASLVRLGDKHSMKAGLRAAGLPTTPGLDESPPDAAFIVKSAVEHGSLGMTAENVVNGAEAARALIGLRTAEFGGEWFAERYVDGREFDVALLETSEGVRALPIAEMKFGGAGPRIMDYASKWFEHSAQAAQIERVFPEHEPQFERIEQLALAAWRAFDLKGFCHVDFRVDGAGTPYILDINANPSIGLRASFCDAAEMAGLTQTDVVEMLIAVA